MAANDYVPIRGTERQPRAGARRISPEDPDVHADLSVILRPQEDTDVERLVRRQAVSREEFAAVRGAHQDDLDAVAQFAEDNGLQVIGASRNRRNVRLSGLIGDVQRAFRAKTALYQGFDGAVYRLHTGAVNVPRELADRVISVEGLDSYPVARQHSRILDYSDDPTQRMFSAATTAGASFPPDVAKLYNFPEADGSGQSIGIIELGGGLRRHDLALYFNQLGLSPPSVKIVSVDNGRNHPSGPNSADGEVMLDIEVAGSIAPGADYVVYFAPNTSRGFLDAITAAVNDTVNQPSIISISWGGPENTWTPASRQAMNQALADAAALGITVFVAAGDSGSSDGEHDGKAHVDFPASSPYVVACGGTRLESSNGGIAEEVVWQTNGATGGGVSDYFSVPHWQDNANVPPSANPPGTHTGRGVPDVAGDADPATGYRIRVDGRQMVVGGTSAVAPLWAALTALLNQDLGTPIGFVNPALYEIATGDGGAFHDITSGSNGAYHAGPGWDACTGLGSPDGASLLTALQDQAGAAAELGDDEGSSAT